MNSTRKSLWGLGLIGLGLAGFAEAAMRFSVETGAWQRLANPGAYFDPTCEDHYWRLLHHSPGWNQGVDLHTAHELDLQLGWTVDKRNKNTWDAWESPAYPLRFEGDAVGVFGDSYVFGTTRNRDRLPDQLAKLLPDQRVLNYGVAGYGFDQTVLAFEAQAERLVGQSALIGVLATDLDRSVLSVRSGPKPYFSEIDGALSLHTDHISAHDAYFESHPVRPLSYLWTYLRINIPRHWQVWIKKQPWNCEVDQKERVNSALFTRLATTCSTLNVDCTVVLFHNPERLGQVPDWRSDLVHRESDRVGLDLVDTRQALLDARNTGTVVYGADRHPNAAGNAVLAAVIGAAVKSSERPLR
jgi:hypothetical protein